MSAGSGAAALQRSDGSSTTQAATSYTAKLKARVPRGGAGGQQEMAHS